MTGGLAATPRTSFGWRGWLLMCGAIAVLFVRTVVGHRTGAASVDIAT